MRKFASLVKIRILRDDFGEKKSPTRDHKPLRWAKPPAAVFLGAYHFAAQFFAFSTSKFLKEYWRSIGEEKKSLAAVLSEIEPKKRSFSIKKEEDFDFFLGAYPN